MKTIVHAGNLCASSGCAISTVAPVPPRGWDRVWRLWATAKWLLQLLWSRWRCLCRCAFVERRFVWIADLFGSLFSKCLPSDAKNPTLVLRIFSFYPWWREDSDFWCLLWHAGHKFIQVPKLVLFQFLSSRWKPCLGILQRVSEFIPIAGLTRCSSCSLPCFTYSNSPIKISGIIHVSKASGSWVWIWGNFFPTVL